MKKALAIGLAAVMAVSMSAPVFAEDEGKGIAKEDLKVGVIYIGDENEGYTAAHMKGIDEMEEKLGLDDSQIIEKTLIGEDEGCYDAAADLADQGCQIILQTALDMRLIYWKQQGNIRRFSSVMQQEHRLHPADFPICITILQIFMKHVTCQV